MAGKNAQRFSSLLSWISVLAVTSVGQEATALDLRFPPPPGFNASPDTKWGSFVVGRTLSFGINATSNLESNPTERNGYEAQTSASLALQSTWDRHSLSFAVAASHRNPINASAVDQTVESGQIQGRYDLSSKLSLNAALFSTESVIATTDLYGGNVNDIVQTNAASVGARWKSGAHFVELAASWQDIDTETTVSGATPSLMGRIEQDLRLQVGRTLSDGQVYIFGGYTDISYDAADVSRDSKGMMVGAGRQWTMDTHQMTTELAFLSQTFAGTLIPDNDGYVGRLEGMWALSDTVALGAKLSRVFDEQNVLPTSAGVYTNRATIGVQIQATEDLLIQFGTTYRIYELHNSSLQMTATGVDVSATWKLQNGLLVPVSLNYLSKSVNSPLLAAQAYNDVNFAVRLNWTY